MSFSVFKVILGDINKNFSKILNFLVQYFFGTPYNILREKKYQKQWGSRLGRFGLKCLIYGIWDIIQLFATKIYFDVIEIYVKYVSANISNFIKKYICIIFFNYTNFGQKKYIIYSEIYLKYIFFPCGINALAATNSNRSSEIVLYGEKMFKEVWGWIWKKFIEAFRFYEILNSSNKRHFCSKFREIQVLRKIVLYNSR